MEPSITCPKCKMTSYHPYDKLHRYCGNCHEFHENLVDREPPDEAA